MFYLKNTTYEVYRELRDKNFSIEKEFNLDKIEICNNENFVLDLTGIKLEGVEILLIYVDWGDGYTNRISKPINDTDVEWKTVTHPFNKTDVSESAIIIKIYNICGEQMTFKIPYTILNKSIYDLSTNFRLLQANVSNKNLTQFIIKEGLKDSIIIVSEKDWKDFT